MLELVIYELQQLFSPSTLEIKLYDANIPDDEDTDVFMLETLESYQVSGKSSPQSIVLVSTLREALQNCDVLIVLGDYRRFGFEFVKYAPILALRDVRFECRDFCRGPRGAFSG